MTQPPRSQLAADLVPGQWVPVRCRIVGPADGHHDVAVSSTTTRWPGLVRTVTRVDAFHVKITVRIVTPDGQRSYHSRTVTCGSHIEVLTQHHAVCHSCGQLAPCSSEHLERSIEAAMHIDLAAIVDGSEARADR